jgi:hypothetical protein
LISDAFLLQLLFCILVAVQTELGVVRELGTEFQKEGTEVAVQAVEVVVID